MVGSLVFITNTGKKSPEFGQGDYYQSNIPEGYRIVGLYGRADKWLHSLGCVVAKTVYTSDGKEEVVYERMSLTTE